MAYIASPIPSGFADYPAQTSTDHRRGNIQAGVEAGRRRPAERVSAAIYIQRFRQPQESVYRQSLDLRYVIGTPFSVPGLDDSQNRLDHVDRLDAPQP